MKMQNLFFKFVLLFCITVFMCSCEKKEEQFVYVDCSLFSADYYGDYYQNGNEDLLFILMDKQLKFSNGKVTEGTGDIVYVDFQLTDLDENKLPKTATYKVSKDWTPNCVASTVVNEFGEHNGSYIKHIVDAKPDSYVKVIDGEVIFTQNDDSVDIKIIFTTEEGDKMAYKYSGPVKVNDFGL